MKGTIVLVGSLLSVSVSLAQPGVLDTTFGTTGYMLVSPPAQFGYGYDLVVQPDGHIILAGYASNGALTGYWAVIRLLDDGTMDSTFGTNGISMTSGSDHSMECVAALQSDGKILVAGYTVTSNDASFTVARFNQDGTIDPAYGTNGEASANVVPGITTREQIKAIVLQPDGSCVVGGRTASGDQADMVFCRFDENGELDPSFGSNGTSLHSLSSLNDQAMALAIQPDGKILVGGSATFGVLPNITGGLALLRMLPDGSLDGSFGVGGLSMPASTEGFGLMDIALQPDGKIITTGQSGFPSPLTTVRFEADGSLDTGFGSGGIVTTSIGANSANGKSITLQPNGKVIVAVENWDGFPDDQDVVLVRYEPDGALDATFGSGGIVLTDLADNGDIAGSVALQSDGKILVGGYSFPPGGDSQFMVLRYLNDQFIGITEASTGDIEVIAAPNPTGDLVTLSYFLERNERVSIRILDGTGRQVEASSRGVPHSIGPQKERIDLRSFAPGFYHVVLCTEHGRKAIPVVKQ